MENMKLTEDDLKLFGEMFARCDDDNSGKVSGPKASELFVTSGLSHEVLHEIIILCGAKRLGHFGRSQFYIALKLIAAVQHGLPVHLDSISSGIDIPLPKFSFDIECIRPQFVNPGIAAAHHVVPAPQHQRVQAHRPSVGYEQVHVNNMANTAPLPTSPTSPQAAPPPPPSETPGSPPPPTSPQASSQHHHQHHHQGVAPVTPGSVMPPKHNIAATVAAAPQTPQQQPQQQHQHVHVNNAASHFQHPAATVAHHPHIHANPAMVAPGHVTAVAAGYIPQQFEAPPHSMLQYRGAEKGWASFEDDNQGLISEEKKEWTRFTDSSQADTYSLSSETDSVDDVWLISDELRKYYLNQFLSMQSDVHDVITGAVAKEFFEKSKLPISELSKIWQLSDVNKDGALSLEEFNTAMHLVVCRINGVELPETLPPSLMPYVPFTNPDEPFASDLPPGSTLKRLTPSSPAPPPSAQWTPGYVQASPSSSVSSPGQKPTPVNFEFKPISEDQDSTIVHPVALRMSPDGQAFPIDSNGKPLPQTQTQSDTGGYNSQDLSPNDQQSPPSAVPSQQPKAPQEPRLVDLGDQEQGHVIVQPTPLQARPRPTPKKAQSVPGPGQKSVAGPLLPTPLEPGVEAPVPPPRTKSHSRSNSLDANQVLNTQGPDSSAPPVVPPRPKDGSSANADMSSSIVSGAGLTSPLDDKEHSGDDLDGKSKAVPKQLDSQEKRDLRRRIKEQRETNLTLSRLNSELNQELQEVMEQRIALEIQMEHLRPYSGGYL